MKLHARLRGQPWPDDPLYVGNDADWRFMTNSPRPTLVCAEEGCESRVSAVEREGTRFLRFAPDTRHCDHWEVGEPHEYVPPTAKRQWMINRVAQICRNLGYAVREQDPASRADVLVLDTGICIQVQLGGTDFARRTEMRQRLGHRVLWMIDADATGRSVNDALFSQPAIRFRVYDKNKPSNASDRGLQPWDEPSAAHKARIEVFATAETEFGQSSGRSTGRVSGYRFLREVLAGYRTWLPPEDPRSVRSITGKSQGAWVFVDRSELGSPVRLHGAGHVSDLQELITGLAHEVVAQYDKTGKPHIKREPLARLRRPFAGDIPRLRSRSLPIADKNELVRLAVAGSAHVRERNQIDKLPSASERRTASAALLLVDVLREVQTYRADASLRPISAAADRVLRDCLSTERNIGRSLPLPGVQDTSSPG